MSGFKIVINVDNSAFDGTDTDTIRILYDVINKLERGDTNTTIRDSNGNKVGSWGYTN